VGKKGCAQMCVDFEFVQLKTIEKKVVESDKEN